MVGDTESVPSRFDAEFLEWFRRRSEAAWAALPERTLEETLVEFLKAGVGGSAWQRGTRWLGGLDDEAIDAAERQWKVAFPPDYRLFLHRLHSVDRPNIRASYLDPIPGKQPPAPPDMLAMAQDAPIGQRE